jgi:mono/diheme cytochrome c family protein
MRRVFGLAAFAAFIAPALAEEPPVLLKAGPGLEEITANCSGCHSLDYVRMNAPFLNADGWKAEVSKMRVAYGAPVDDEDSAKIVAYLAANYGPPP